MNVKRAFLNNFIKEADFNKQPPNFEHAKFPDHVFKLKKTLHYLKKVPRT